MGGPGAQVTDAGGRLEGWQPSGRLAGPCGRLVGPDGRPGAGKKDSLASGADRLVGLAGRQADRPCWQQAGRPGARLAGPAVSRLAGQGQAGRPRRAAQVAGAAELFQDIVAWSRSFN